MKNRIVFAFLLITLAACTPVVEPVKTPAQPNATDIQNTAVAIAQTGVALTQAVLPTVTPLPPTVTPTATNVYPTSSPFPTNPPTIMITPDAVQVAEWEKYQTEIIKVVLPHSSAVIQETALCEWVILGRSGQELYLYVVCSRDSMPVVVYLNEDGSLQDVKAPSRGSTWDSQIQTMFPADVREKLDLYYFNVCVYCGRPEELRIHLLYRQTHPEVPPLVVLSSMPIATPTP